MTVVLDDQSTNWPLTDWRQPSTGGPPPALDARPGPGAPRPRCIARIDAEVEQDLLDLGRINVHGRHGLIHLHTELERGRHAACSVDRAPCTTEARETAARAPVSTTEHQHLLYQVARALTGALRLRK